MKCIIWKNTMEQPDQKLLGAFKAKAIGDYWIGELNQESIKRCDKSFTVWKPRLNQLTKQELAITAKAMNVDGSELQDDKTRLSAPQTPIPWILDTYPSN